MASPSERNAHRARAHAAAAKYQPRTIRVLVIVEAPTDDASPAFYVDPADADGLPVVPRSVPLPMHRPDIEFARRFRTALVHAGLEALIKPLP